ncbi:CZB domain-containing protein [Hymenobacter endophyticus]|uniref:CZB domain-containing protein n=1 Tax=Hymenobacter endophyticus TaxID=3076335 RepID=A0ABU3TIM9_9BACT|nr:CZB domain-containing protein [Hymenobacter endophyticus]MDU0371085.1 CZB domain-containing protein [Hymenobacter endophyticus]
MTDELKQEFDGARIKHLHFKSKLRSFLYGSSTAEAPIRDPRQCSFGQWITTYVLTRYGQLPESRELDAVHTQIHLEANRLMDMAQRGRQDEAIAGMAEINRLADLITRLLRTLEDKIRTGR